MDWVDFRTLPKTPSWKIQPWVVKFQFIGVILNRTSFLLESPFLLGISSIEPYPNPQVNKYNPGSIVHEYKWIQYLTLTHIIRKDLTKSAVGQITDCYDSP